jgi:hypothetical protein
MILKTHHLLVLAAAISALPAPRALASDEDATNGRALVKQYADSIVSVEVVATIRLTVGDHALPPRENKVEENGTVLTSSGLTVSVLSAIDPHDAMEAMINSRGAGGQKIEIGETEFKDVKLRLANNTEVPAVIVLKDPDLNLIFIAPLSDAANPPRKFSNVSLEKSTTGEVLGDYFVVSRAAKSLQRVPVVRKTTVMGIVEKPRQMFIMSEQALGVPVFDPTGLILGISTQYLDNGRPGPHVVLTAADIAELATQAAAIKPEDMEPKEAPPATGDQSGPPTEQPAAVSQPPPKT